MVKRRLMALALLVALLLSIATAAEAQEPRFHIVTYGQTLSSIAWRYGFPVRALVDANGLRNPNLIFVGQRLRIPEPVGPSLTVHPVQPSESLLTIAARYGVTVRQIATRNGIANINLIFVGQRLSIPTGDVAVAPIPGAGAPRVQAAIIITSPITAAAVSSPVVITGWGRAFENSLAVDILDEVGMAIGQGFAVIDADLGQMGPFTGTVEFTPPAAAQVGRIQVYSISPRDGAIEHLSSVEVNLRP